MVYDRRVVVTPKRRRWEPGFVLALVLVAAAAGGFAILFRATLAAVVRAVAGVTSIVDAMAASEWWWRLTLPMAGALVAGLLSLAIAKRGGGGVSDVMEAVALGKTRLSMLVTLVKSAASWCAIVCGGSLGREGPLIQFGGTAGDSLGRRMGIG